MEDLAVSIEALLVRDAQLVRATGRLTAGNRHRLRRAVLKCLAECPVAVIVDVAGLELDEPQAVTVFVALHRAAAAANVQLLLQGSHGLLAERVRVLDPALRQFRNLAEAVVAIGAPPPDGRWLHRRFAPGPEMLSLAGCLVADACSVWQVPALIHPARSVLYDLMRLGQGCPAAHVHVVVALRRTGLLVSVRSQLVAGHWPGCSQHRPRRWSTAVIHHSRPPDGHARWALLPVEPG
ncbi:STAS domain-containing protein [Dactylosporangium sp. NPDC050688]|uniref:STAS domain-containing protein n=1 Tax=Dactylosporangium sp. NPDC050688 TaxID=3157217 RepID=UPI0033FE22E9